MPCRPIAIAALFGIDLEVVKEVLEHFRPAPMRMEVHSLGNGSTLINDAYNANPRSVEMALETLAEAKGGGRAIAVLGDMLELGRSCRGGPSAGREKGRRAFHRSPSRHGRVGACGG